jgi:hypothetical protein
MIRHRILGLFVEWGKLNVLKCEKNLAKNVHKRK